MSDLYSISVFFEIVIKEAQALVESVWEESVVLIRADNPEKAEDIASKWGIEQELEYKNGRGQQCKKLFRATQAYFQILTDPPEHLTEIHGRFLRPADAKSLLKPFESADG